MEPIEQGGAVCAPPVPPSTKERSCPLDPRPTVRRLDAASVPPLETVCEANRGHEAHNRSRLCCGCEGQRVCQADFAMAVSESRSRAVAISATASSISSSRVENPKLNRIDASASSPDIPMARST